MLYTLLHLLQYIHTYTFMCIVSYIQSIEYDQYMQSQNTPPHTAKHIANQHEPTQTLPPPTPLVTSPPHFNIPPLSYASTLPTLSRLQNTTTSSPLYSASIQYRIEVNILLLPPDPFLFFTTATISKTLPGVRVQTRNDTTASLLFSIIITQFILNTG